MAVFDLPPYGLIECTFTLDDGTASTGFNRGMSFNVTQVSDPTFRIKVQTDPLDQAGMQAWTSWKARLRGGINRFAAYDHSRAAPLAYRDAHNPAQIASGWAGTATVTSVGLSGALGLAGLPAGYTAKEGDRVALEENGFVGLYEVIADATATGAGALALTVEPFLHRSTFTTAAVARLWQPKGLFMIDWRSWGMSVTAEPSSISFDGYQVLK